MSSRRRRAPPSRGGSEIRFAIVLLLIAIGFFAFTGVVEGPKAVRQAWSQVGVKNVEAHSAILCAAAAESGLDPCLLAGVMYVESRGKVDAVSHKGALGLFQLMPSAASDAAKKLKLPTPTREQLLSDPLLNARLAGAHLSWLYRHEGPGWERVLVAYNAGRGTLARWLKDAGGWTSWHDRHAARGDSDALTYAQQVLDFAERFRRRGIVIGGAADAVANTGE